MRLIASGYYSIAACALPSQSASSLPTLMVAFG
jgi:hypothetical protein